MMTGNRNPGYTGKYTRKRRFSGKSLALLVSALVLSFAMVGGTLAWLTAGADAITNNLNVPVPGIDIDEDFDGSVKENVGITNTGDIPLYVRLRLVINFQHKPDPEEGQVPAVAPVAAEQGKNIEIQWSGNENWVQGSDGYYYYRLPLAPESSTAPLINSIKPLPGADIPEGYDLDVQVLAQYVQKDGLKGGRPIVESSSWPVTVQSDGSLTVN